MIWIPGGSLESLDGESDQSRGGSPSSVGVLKKGKSKVDGNYSDIHYWILVPVFGHSLSYLCFAIHFE